MSQKYLDSLFNPVALRTAKIVWSFDRSECNRVKVLNETKSEMAYSKANKEQGPVVQN